MIRQIFGRNKHINGTRKIVIIPAYMLGFMLVLILALVILPAGRVNAYDEIVIVIDPGHGGVVTADNSNGGCMYNNLCEKDVNLITATALYNELSQYKNVVVYMTRTADVELPLDQRIAFAKNVGADVMISVHYNASNDHIFYGSEIFTSMYGKPRATGYGLATCIMKQWEEFGSASKGIKTRKGNNGDYYGLIRQGKEIGLPVIILEHGYLDNDNDFARMGSAQEWQELGTLDATGIADYYGLKKDLVQGTIAPTVNVQSYSAPALPDETAPTSVKLVVDEYNRDTGVIKYSVSAAEDADDLMYFGVVKGPVTDETVFTDLKLWDNSKGVQTGEIKVPAEYSGQLTARVYNSYELYTDSDSIDLSKIKNGGGSEDTNSDSDEASGGENDPDQKASGGSDNEGGNPSAKSGDADDFAGEANELEVIDTIIVNSEAGDKIEITPDMIEAAEESVSLENRAKIGLAIAGSVVVLVLVIAVALGIYKFIGSIKRDKKNGYRKMYDWEDKNNDY